MPHTGDYGGLATRRKRTKPGAMRPMPSAMPVKLRGGGPVPEPVAPPLARVRPRKGKKPGKKGF